MITGKTDIKAAEKEAVNCKHFTLFQGVHDCTRNCTLKEDCKNALEFFLTPKGARFTSMKAKIVKEVELAMPYGLKLSVLTMDEKTAAGQLRQDGIIYIATSGIDGTLRLLLDPDYKPEAKSNRLHPQAFKGPQELTFIFREAKEEKDLEKFSSLLESWGAQVREAKIVDTKDQRYVDSRQGNFEILVGHWVDFMDKYFTYESPGYTGWVNHTLRSLFPASKTIINKKGNRGIYIGGWNLSQYGVAMIHFNRFSEKADYYFQNVEITAAGKKLMRGRVIESGSLWGYEERPDFPIYETLQDAQAEVAYRFNHGIEELRQHCRRVLDSNYDESYKRIYRKQLEGIDSGRMNWALTPYQELVKRMEGGRSDD